MGGAVGRAVGCFCGEAGREDEADVNRCAGGVAGGLIDCGRGFQNVSTCLECFMCECLLLPWTLVPLIS